MGGRAGLGADGEMGSKEEAGLGGRESRRRAGVTMGRQRGGWDGGRAGRGEAELKGGGAE